MGDHRYRLETVPAFAFGPARGDVVRVERHGTAQWVERLLEPSGHSTVRVNALGDTSVEVPKTALELMGCFAYPTVIDGMIAVDVPALVDFETVRA